MMRQSKDANFVESQPSMESAEMTNPYEMKQPYDVNTALIIQERRGSQLLKNDSQGTGSAREVDSTELTLQNSLPV